MNLKNDGWSCYSYIDNRSHCELRFDFCEQARASISPDYKAEECRRVDLVWCFERPGDEPIPTGDGDPPMVEETIRRWCYRTPEECRVHDPDCVEIP